jgi:ectoine hydroxylase-related dioxygenase (phytanoyl-CoA dioxygenase family)
MLLNEQIDQYHRAGFVNGGPLLDDQTVEVLRAEVLRVIADRDNPAVAQPVLLRDLSAKPSLEVWQILNIWEASPAFRALAGHPKLLEMVRQLSGAQQLRIWHDQIVYKPKEAGGVLGWHQDSPLWDILQPKTEQVTAWIALDDAEADNGCMYMVAGSHRWGDRLKAIERLRDEGPMPERFEGHDLYVLTCPVKKGYVHFHHPLTWHGSGTNYSSRPRRAVAIHFMTEKVVYDDGGAHPMKAFVHVKPGEMLEGDSFPKVWG